LISDDGRALLTDFGSSRLAEALFSLVVKGDQKGALDWMAPEHFQQNKFTISTESNVWAFGMTTLVSHLSALPVTMLDFISLGVAYKEPTILSFAVYWCHNESYYGQKVDWPRCILFLPDG